jgi:hypothetical protein
MNPNTYEMTLTDFLATEQIAEVDIDYGNCLVTIKPFRISGEVQPVTLEMLSRCIPLAPHAHVKGDVKTFELTPTTIRRQWQIKRVHLPRGDNNSLLLKDITIATFPMDNLITGGTW